jgi:hypothetical protein
MEIRSLMLKPAQGRNNNSLPVNYELLNSMEMKFRINKFRQENYDSEGRFGNWLKTLG